MNKKTTFTILFYIFCFCLFFLFTLFAREKGWISAETYFFSFRSRMLLLSGIEQPKNLFLTYPFFPLLLSLISFLPTLIPPVIGIFTTLLLDRTISQEGSLRLLVPLLITSPFFLLSIFSPTFLLLGLFIAVAVANIVRYHETQLIYFFFLGGITLGIGVLNHTSLFWACLPIIIFQLLFFNFPFPRKISLLLVSLFPPLFFLASLFFFHWVYSYNLLFFLNSTSLSLSQAIPELFLPLPMSITQWIISLWYIFPFLVVLGLQGSVRFFWVISALALAIILYRHLPVFLTISFLIMNCTLLWSPKNKVYLKIGVVLLLFVSGFGWFQLLRGNQAFFSLNSIPLQNKISDYEHIEEQVDLSSASILVLDHHSFLSSSWQHLAPSIVPTPDSFEQACNEPNSCSFIFVDRNRVMDYQDILKNFIPIWEGKELVLYEKKKRGS